jgi:predicted DNA-binding transcriptional regulator AlpA
MGGADGPGRLSELGVSRATIYRLLAEGTDQ